MYCERQTYELMKKLVCHILQDLFTKWQSGNCELSKEGWDKKVIIGEQGLVDSPFRSHKWLLRTQQFLGHHPKFGQASLSSRSELSHLHHSKPKIKVSVRLSKAKFCLNLTHLIRLA